MRWITSSASIRQQFQVPLREMHSLTIHCELSLFIQSHTVSFLRCHSSAIYIHRILTIQLFECLNVATQSLCASYLGVGDVVNARAIMHRLMLLGGIVGIGAGLLVFLVQTPLIGFFTKDPIVVREVGVGVGMPVFLVHN